ncbi:MAG: SDR family NAD(P)-dependent oxidoreductase [Flavobacteriales bacterium]
MDEKNFTDQEWEACIKVLTQLKDNPFNNPDNELFSGLVVKIYKKAKKYKSAKNNEKSKQEDLMTFHNAVIAYNAINNKTIYSEGEKVEEQTFTKLNKPKNCYVCNGLFTKVHFFYGRMCPTCAIKNYDHRFESIDLAQRNVIITGGRVKLGFSAALKFLRAGANVMVTSRFPASALEQFKGEKDYKIWDNRLMLYGLDLRSLQAVETFVQFYKSKFKQLDVLVNNAAQTIKYTDQYYMPIVAKERQLLLNNKENERLIPNPISVLQETALIASDKRYEDFALNRFGSPIDTREKNSWNSTLEDISMYELLEVNLINQISPYFLIKELTPLLKNSSFKNKFIINVTSSEGQFSYANKTIHHPHTNMTKAALNMLTRTSAKEYSESQIYMYAVDVGWISTGATEKLRKKQFERGYIPPLDSVDGAARILHPIIEGIKENPILAGVLLKNYQIEQW